MIEQERVERLQAWSRDNDITRSHLCPTCRDTGTVLAYQRIGGQMIRVTGGCPKCDRVPEGLPRIDLSDPSLVWEHERPEPFVPARVSSVAVSPPAERPRYADPPLSEEPIDSAGPFSDRRSAEATTDSAETQLGDFWGPIGPEMSDDAIRAAMSPKYGED